jgi:hypothetical protein
MENGTQIKIKRDIIRILPHLKQHLGILKTFHFVFKFLSCMYLSFLSWLRSEPWGFRKLLRWLQKEYSNITIYITENGFSTDESEYETRDSSYDVIADFDRMFYFHDYINQLKASIIEDHVDVQVYTAWSLYDNFEWVAGYS